MLHYDLIIHTRNKGLLKVLLVQSSVASPQHLGLDNNIQKGSHPHLGKG